MAGEFTSAITTTAKFGSLTIGGVTQTLSGDQQVSVSKSIPGTLTNVEVDLTVDVSTVQLMAIESDQDATVKTNSTSSPVDTLNLKAKQPLIWTKDQPAGTAFFTADVTKVYITTGSALTTVKFGALTNIIPSLD